jgi:hypothetical protein
MPANQMNASQCIINEFDRLLTLGREEIRRRPFAEQVLYFVVVARCEADMEGFSSIYEQALTADEMQTLIGGLRQLDEPKLAIEFAGGMEALEKEKFYDHRNWNRVPDQVKEQIDAIGQHIGSELWGLDEKLAALIDRPAAERSPGS